MTTIKNAQSGKQEPQKKSMLYYLVLVMLPVYIFSVFPVISEIVSYTEIPRKLSSFGATGSFVGLIYGITFMPAIIFYITLLCVIIFIFFDVKNKLNDLKFNIVNKNILIPELVIMFIAIIITVIYFYNKINP